MDVIILAAGEGTRMRPLTSTRPKPMLPIAGKPILEWNLEALDCVGVKKAVIIVGYMSETIKEYFGDKFRNIQIEYILQEEQLGTGNAVQVAEKKVDNEFIVMNGDLFITRKFLSTFLENHKRNNAKNSMSLVEVEKPQEYGVVEIMGNMVVSLSEKPKKPKTNLVNAGVYIFNTEIFPILNKIKKSKRKEYELTDAIKKLIDEQCVFGFECGGQWIDIGRPWNILDANEIVMKSIKLEKNKKSEIEKYTTIKGEVHVGEGTLVKSGVYIEGPVFIGKNCVIGPNCYIRSCSVIMDDCKVGNAVEIKNSIIMSNSNVGHLSYVGDSIIGENCNFGAGTKVANLRFDDEEVEIEVKQKRVKSGRRKFGCLMGDNVKTGINVSIMPGRSIYPGSQVEAGSTVKNTIFSE